MKKSPAKTKPRIMLTNKPNKLFVRNDEVSVTDSIRKLINRRLKNAAELMVKIR